MTLVRGLTWCFWRTSLGGPNIKFSKLIQGFLFSNIMNNRRGSKKLHLFRLEIFLYPGIVLYLIKQNSSKYVVHPKMLSFTRISQRNCLNSSWNRGQKAGGSFFLFANQGQTGLKKLFYHKSLPPFHIKVR